MTSLTPPFWLDSNSLIEAKDRWYPFELVPKFWQHLAAGIETGAILSPHAVYKELAAGNDQLADFVKNRKSLMNYPPDDCTFAEMNRISDYVSGKYKRNQSEEFLTGADPWIIATAKCRGGTLITGESKGRKKKIRIPTICDQFGVPFGEIWEMVRHFQWNMGADENS
jgi:hypothetical protein